MAQSQLEGLPIDIHYNKLLDWLINRRHCGQRWTAAAVIVRGRIDKALVDMPENGEISSMIEDTTVNYFHCKRISELLKETDHGEKNVFGQYSSQKMKDWVEIVKLYEKDGLFLAETAQMIARNVNYEVPAYKKQIAKSQQINKDCSRKETDYISNAAELQRKYDKECKKLGIEGKKIKTELSLLARDLPSVYDRISTSCNNLKPACDYYENFVNFTLEREKTESLSVLKYVQENGNTSTFQWRTGTIPDVIEEPRIDIDTTDEIEDEKQSDTGEIDWGETGGDNANIDSIDFGDIPESNLDSIDIGDTAGIEICDITVESGGHAGSQDNSERGSSERDSNGWVVTAPPKDVHITDKDTGVEGVAQGEDALTLLDNTRTRNLFVDDLMELEAFLLQRISDVDADSGDVLSSSQFEEAPQSIQIDSVQLMSMLTDVQNLVNELTTETMQHLMFIRHSPRYVERLKGKLKQFLMLADKMKFLEKDMIDKQKQAFDEQKIIEPKLATVVKHTKIMQKQIEEEISKKYKDRRVNVMGEINTI